MVSIALISDDEKLASKIAKITHKVGLNFEQLTKEDFFDIQNHFLKNKESIYLIDSSFIVCDLIKNQFLDSPKNKIFWVYLIESSSEESYGLNSIGCGACYYTQKKNINEPKLRKIIALANKANEKYGNLYEKAEMFDKLKMSSEDTVSQKKSLSDLISNLKKLGSQIYA